jgi:hypothetical protein
MAEPYYAPDGLRGPGWYISDGVEARGPFRSEISAWVRLIEFELELQQYAASQYADDMKLFDAQLEAIEVVYSLSESVHREIRRREQPEWIDVGGEAG